MADDLPPVGPFAAEFVTFLQAMHEAAEFPDGPWMTRLRHHLGVELGELPITTASFRVADPERTAGAPR